MQEAGKSLTNKLFLFSFLKRVGNGIWGFLSIFLLDIGGSGLDVGILAFLPGFASACTSSESECISSWITVKRRREYRKMILKHIFVNSVKTEKRT